MMMMMSYLTLQQHVTYNRATYNLTTYNLSTYNLATYNLATYVSLFVQKPGL